MHIRIRSTDNFITSSVSILVGPRGIEEKSPLLQKIWDEEHDACSEYQKNYDEKRSLGQENPSIMDIVLYVQRVTRVPFPRIIIEFFDFGFTYVFTSHNGLSRWFWTDVFPLAPPGTRKNHFFAGSGEMVPVSFRAQRVITALMAAYKSPIAFHTELDDPFKDRHDHWVVRVWLSASIEEDKPADSNYVVVTACGSISVSNLFNAICDSKASQERFCIMQIKWVNGKLVKGLTYSYQTAIKSKITVAEMGWPNKVWLWPCHPLDHLESDTGLWENNDLVGFDSRDAGNPMPKGSVLPGLLISSSRLVPPVRTNRVVPLVIKDMRKELLNLLKEGQKTGKE